MPTERNSSLPKELDADVIIVGAGVAGLTAAALLARAGRSVIVLEKGVHLGGRAMTTVRDDIHFNLGPHALYCHGHAFRLLKELDVPFRGKPPEANGRFLLDGERLHPIPAGLGQLISSRLLTIREKFQLANLLRTLPKLSTHEFDNIPLNEWIWRTAGTGNLAALLQTLFRVATYAADHDVLSAGAALEQFQIALNGNVWYLDGGWQTIIDGLAAKAVQHGGSLRSGAPVHRINSANGRITVDLSDGSQLSARAGILAVDPQAACRLLDLSADAPLAQWSAERMPVRSACLDVALRMLPSPNHVVTFGLREPLYFSVHSAVAQLAPPGVAVVHVAKYLHDQTETAPADLERELEQMLDRLQPGWRDKLLTRRFFPSMIVTGALPKAATGGLSGNAVRDFRRQFY